MKKSASLIAYLSSLVIGIILLALHEQVKLLQGVVIAIGVLITIPSAFMFVSALFGKKDEYGNRNFPAWYTIIVAIAGLVLGIWMLCKPTWFEAWMVYTLGVVLILVGAAQFSFIFSASKPFGANPWWYCVPILTIVGGFIICFIGPDGANQWAAITTGVILIVYAANGLASVGRERKLEKEIKEELENIPSDNDVKEL